MKQLRKITWQFGASYVFTFLTILAAMLGMPLLTRFLSLHDFGVFSLLSSTVTTLVAVLSFGLPTYIVTKIARFPAARKRIYQASIIKFELFLLGSVLLAMVMLPKAFMWLLKLEGLAFELRIAAIILASSVLFDLFSYYLIAWQRIEFSCAIAFLCKSGWIIIIAALLMVSGKISLLSVLACWLIGIIISLLLEIGYVITNKMLLPADLLRAKASAVKEALAFSLPMLGVTFLSWFMVLMQRYVINYLLDITLVGIYSLAFSVNNLALTLAAVISGVMYPYISKAFKAKKYMMLMNAFLKYSLLVAVPASIGLAALREQVITLISGPDYLAAAPAVAFLTPVPILLSIITVYTLHWILGGKTAKVAMLYALGAATSLALSIMLVKLAGINGAAIALTLSYGVMAIVLVSQMRKELTWNLAFIRIDRILLASALMGVVVALVNPQEYLGKLITVIIGSAVFVAAAILLKVIVKEEYDIIGSFTPKALKPVVLFLKKFSG